VTVLFAAGGTGGHLYPAFAIADALRARGDDALFVGTRDRLESRLVPAAGYRFETIAAHPLRRRLSVDLVKTVAANAVGFFQALRVLERARPSLVVATGGYVCVPLVLAARADRTLRRRRMPVALLEPNVVAGIANRILAPFVDETWDAATTGVPVRASLLHLQRRGDAVAALGLDPERKTVLAFGGSLGARSINDAVAALVLGGGVPPGWQVLLVTGADDYERVRAAIGNATIVRSYLDDPAQAYAAADLVIARAGASTLAELRALRLPAVLVPYPHAAEAHQRANAMAAAATGAAVVIDDAALAGGLRSLLARIASPERLAAMRVAAGPAGDPIAAILARIDALTSRT
jgi:UDP-N-acetylglucosamine--N-acetylmuramyl-(pentapeptide) pyrophosphoryl-undecaprenol N-acetylglucosamine transferase